MHRSLRFEEPGNLRRLQLETPGEGGRPRRVIAERCDISTEEKQAQSRNTAQAHDQLEGSGNSLLNAFMHALSLAVIATLGQWQRLENATISVIF
jgi:hypothetical protein